jgi:hypothetical protein
MRLLIACLLSVSCTGLTGEWQGRCGEEDPLELELDVEFDSSGELEGEAVMTFDFSGSQTSIDLDLEGSRDGRDFVMELDQAGWMLILEGERADGRLEGICQLYGTVGEGSLWSEGPFELLRAD